ncbi:MAG TPA: hypothetical protein VHB21_22170 [Minicystis sp.]|nr:hypothetical protein [Minicystis sp.]
MTSPAIHGGAAHELEAPGAPPEPPPDHAPAPAAEAPRGLGAILVEDWRRSTFWEILREVYCRFDRRALGFTRILIGFFFLMDLFHRTVVWNDMYSSVGVLPTHLNLQRPLAYGAWSFFNAFETPGELVALWVVMFATYTCLLVGYKTKVAQILSMIFVVSMNGRVLLIENGGYVVHNLLAMWTCFLPLGDRFSVDALLASMKAPREATEEDLNDRTTVVPERTRRPHYSLLGPVLFVQIGAIYFFNYIHKTGPAWHNGTAVHYVLYVDRMVTPFTALIRDHIPPFVILFMTRSTVAFELALAFVLFSPVANVWCRRAVIFMMCTLHIAFGTSMVLGPFAWACCIFSTLLFSTDDVELAYATMRRPRRARVVRYDRASGAALFACRVLKRLDGFDLLTFRAADDVPMGLAVDDPAGGAPRTWNLAVADIIAALPLGPLFAWPLRAPGLGAVARRALAFFDRQNPSEFFGLRVPPHGAIAAEPSPVRRGVRKWLLGTVRELGIAIMFAGAVNQASVELWAINRRWHVPQPEIMRLLSLKLRFLQGWFMFSPNPVMDDGTIVVDALTVDGRHIDPFEGGKPPNFDLEHVKSYAYSQIWCDYLNRIHLPANSAYRDQMKEFMLRYHERTGRPNDEIVSGDVYWIQDMNPRWGETKSWKFEKMKLFSFERPGAHRGPSGELRQNP